MAGVSLKTDFKDGDKLFGQQLNNNFGAIQAALNTMNKIVWQDDPDDMVVTFRGTTEEINSRDIIDGQLLYDTTTGETYIDYGSQRISTGSGNAIFIGDTEPTNPSTQLWIKPNEPMQVIGSEVTNSLEGNETNKAPSVKAVNDRFTYISDEQLIGTWINGEPLYRKIIDLGELPDADTKGVATGLEPTEISLTKLYGIATTSTGSFQCSLNDFNARLILISNGNLDITTEDDYSSFNGIAILEYTKITGGAE